MSDTQGHTDAHADANTPGEGMHTGRDAQAERTENADSLDQAMDRLHEADPGDTKEVLDAGNEANDRLQERLRDTAPQ